ncbi:MAG TPA: hypothetical protein VIR63_00915, partial [Pontiella sp.]
FLSQGAGGTASGIFVFLSYLFIPRIPNMLTYEEGVRAGALKLIYFTAPHLELFDMRVRVIHSLGLLDLRIFIATVLYGILLTTAFMGIAWLIFSKKHFKRGEHA